MFNLTRDYFSLLFAIVLLSHLASPICESSQQSLFTHCSQPSVKQSIFPASIHLSLSIRLSSSATLSRASKHFSNDLAEA